MGVKHVYGKGEFCHGVVCYWGSTVGVASWCGLCQEGPFMWGVVRVLVAIVLGVTLGRW